MNKDSVYFKFVRYSSSISHQHHVCNYWLAGRISYV